MFLPPDFLRKDVTLMNYEGEDWSKYEAAILVERVSGASVFLTLNLS